jgi:hypothetical protein
LYIETIDVTNTLSTLDANLSTGDLLNRILSKKIELLNWIDSASEET